ncbi:MAG TPA: hypothetical protein VFD01_17140 [Candidatus Dormibacteraeota bacterium]|jgi:hypothetical protein|nr:hypothetical protein [Candidatus Dormibacteraeota bacterium]
MSSLDFLWLALGVGALLVAVALCLVLRRLYRVLVVLEDTLLAADEAIREVTPEVRDGLGNVNEIAGGVNLALRAGGAGAARLGRAAAASYHEGSLSALAALHGLKVGVRSLVRALLAGPEERPTGGQPDGE